MYPGTRNPRQTGKIVWHNGQTYINRVIDYFNGVDIVSFNQGLDDELSPTEEQNLLQSQHNTNGMQFMPNVDNNDNLLGAINVMDPTNLMLMTYNKDGEADAFSNTIDIELYTAAVPYDGQGPSEDVSLAFQQLYSMYGAGCKGCDFSRDMPNVFIGD